MSLDALLDQCLKGRDPLPLALAEGGRWETWLQPISPTEPVGQDPAYDDDFQQLREEVNTLSGADTDGIIRTAQTLLSERCKDLRVATYYLWARLYRDGEPGLADGLSLLAALLARFGDQLLPARPNSRLQALQWLASAKVLDTLARYPEVALAEAARTVAGLAWLEQGLQAWPQAQRPALGALYSSLTERLARAGGADTLVPQTRASPALPPPRQATISSGRDVLDQGRLLATWLREQPHGWLAAHRLMTGLRWNTLHQPPPQDGQGRTRLAAPRAALIAQLARLHRQRQWPALLEQASGAFAEGVNHFWFDLQWYLHQALEHGPEVPAGWADALCQDLAIVLVRLPGVEAMCWDDGTPMASDVTREWIGRLQAPAQPKTAWLPAAAEATPAGNVLALESQALAQADSDGVDAALAWLAEQPGMHSGRQRWLLRLLMARLAEQFGRMELALHVLGELDANAQSRRLAEWEPELAFEVQARLLKLLRAKAQRGGAGATALNERINTLLAALVASDPVRAAVLCP